MDIHVDEELLADRAFLLRSIQLFQAMFFGQVLVHQNAAGELLPALAASQVCAILQQVSMNCLAVIDVLTV